MPLLNPHDLKIGQSITFKTKYSLDTVTWKGRVVAFLEYNEAIKQYDILPYYSELKKEYPEFPPITELTFFKLKLPNEESRIFAIEYIDPSTLYLNDVFKTIDLQIINTSQSEIGTLLDLLRSHGYIAIVK